MRIALACFSFLLAIVFYGIFLFWIVGTANAVGWRQLTTEIPALGWRAGLWGIGMPALGTLFLVAGMSLAAKPPA